MKFKKFVSVLTAALVVATAVPVVDASAAVKPDKMKIVTNSNKKKSKHTLALGEIKSIKSVGKATANVRFSPKNSSNALRLTSDDSSIVKVSKSNSSGTSWTMTGMATGTANITVRSAVKSSVKSNLTVTVTSRTPSNIEISKSSLTMLPNETATIGAMNVSSTVEVTFNNTKVDRFINVSSSDNEVVRVNKDNNKNFTLKALKAGTANITVASATDPSVKRELTVTVKSTELPASFSAKQSKKDQLLVTFAQALPSNPSIKEFKLREKGASWDLVLKDLVMSSDRKAAFINAYIDLRQNTKYELIYSPANAQPQIAEFESSDNKPVRLEILTDSAVVNLPKKIKYVLTDSNGVNVTGNAPGRISIESDSRDAYVDSTSNTIIMFQPGKTANIKVTYHTGQFVNGQELTIVAARTITALTVSNINMSLEKVAVKSGPSELSDASWNQVNSMYAMVPSGSENTHLVFRVKSSENEIYSSDRTYNGVSFSFESLNKDILNIHPSNGQITLVGSGTVGKQAVVVISVTIEGKTFKYTVPVNIGEASFPSRIEIKPAEIPFLKLNAQAPTKIEIKIFDQYNTDITKTAYGLVRIEPQITLTNSHPTITIQQPTYDNPTNVASFSLQAAGTQFGYVPYKVVSSVQQNRPIGGFVATVTP